MHEIVTDGCRRRSKVEATDFFDDGVGSPMRVDERVEWDERISHE